MIIAFYIIMWGIAILVMFAVVAILLTAGPLVIESIMETNDEWRRVFRKIKDRWSWRTEE